MSALVFARNCCMARMLPGEAELVSDLNRSARGGKVCGLTDWMLRYI